MNLIARILRNHGILLSLVLLLPGLSTGCRSPRVVPLMPTPMLFTELGVSPLEQVPPEMRWPLRKVYYATVRARNPDIQRIDYTNEEADRMSAGLAVIGFGRNDVSWEELDQASRASDRDQPIALTLNGLIEAGAMPLTRDEPAGAGAMGWLAAELNGSIRTARDKDLLLYVHGAKVNFYNACAFAAQLDHFMGRDMTSMAFAWPTRQSILAYGFGGDVERAHRSGLALARLLEWLADHAEARRIHILAWSAGGRVTTRALQHLHTRMPDASADTLRNRYRIGTVYYAAADVPGETFLDALPVINRLARRVVVTASTQDWALDNARRFMGGGMRIGQVNTGLAPGDVATLLEADRLEVVDVSRGSPERGFDITGHGYWFSHPWASSDMILAIRSDLPALERGLQETEVPILWWMPENYPDRLRVSMLRPDLTLREAEAPPGPAPP